MSVVTINKSLKLSLCIASKGGNFSPMRAPWSQMEVCSWTLSPRTDGDLGRFSPREPEYFNIGQHDGSLSVIIPRLDVGKP